MSAMGLDLSMTRSGVTIPGGATYSIKARAKDDTRLIEIEDQLIYYMDLVRPTICVIEQIPPVSFNVNIAITLGTVHALARKELARRRIPMVYILPKLLKKYATGSGSSDKTAMVAAAVGHGAAPANDDEADSWWAYQAGEHFEGRPVSPMHALAGDLLFGDKSHMKWPSRSAASKRPG